MVDSCSIEANGLISIDQALQTINNTLAPISDCERVVLKNALGRILASSVFSAINIPPDRNSAMDGYAFSSSDIKPGQSFSLSLVGTSWAGNPFKNKLNQSEC